MKNNKFRKEREGLYVRKDSKPPILTLPPGRTIGSKAPPSAGISGTVPKMPPPPAKVDIPPMTDDIIKLDESDIIIDEPKPVLSKETKKLRSMLAGRAPEINNTGIDYNGFIEGIKRVTKITGVKTGNKDQEKEVTVLLLDTKYGEYIASNMMLYDLRDKSPKMMDYASTGAIMKIPVGGDGKRNLFIERVEKRDEMGRNSGFLEMDKDNAIPTKDNGELSDRYVQKISLMHLANDKVSKKIKAVLYKLEEENILMHGMEIIPEKVEFVENELLEPYLSVKTANGSEYWIFIRYHGCIGRTFPLPGMDGLTEVTIDERKEKKSEASMIMRYAVLRYKATNDAVSFDLDN